jgi:hypothetical protein
MASTAAARDGRTTMRIVFANGIEDILRRPAGPDGRILKSTVLAMRILEATAHPWVRVDQAFLEEMKVAEKIQGDEGVLARWTAVLAGLQRASMLDQRQTPRDDIGGQPEAEQDE